MRLKIYTSLFMLTILTLTALHHIHTTLSRPTLTVSFLNIGQGDATLIQTPSGTTALIDGGPNNLALHHLGNSLGFFNRHIDYLIQTHTDSDHIASFPEIMERYTVDTLITHPSHATNSITEYYSDDIYKITISADERIVLDPVFGTYLHVHYPPATYSNKNKNDTSLIMTLHHGSTCIMFTGDASKKVEKKITQSITLQSCDVLQVGHHGSKTSTHQSFLERFAFTDAIISAGENNRHGHPHKDVISTLKNSNTTIYSTAHDGTVTLTSDGETFTISSSETVEPHFSLSH